MTTRNAQVWWPTPRTRLWRIARGGLVMVLLSSALPASAQTRPEFEIKAGSWVEGPGYVVRWDMGPRSLCEAACLADPKCRMFEYWKPRAKCNLYDHTRIQGPSRESDVGIRLQR